MLSDVNGPKAKVTIFIYYEFIHLEVKNVARTNFAILLDAKNIFDLL
jgi:hypothetical protein